MGIKEQAQNAVKAAFQAAGTLKTSIALKTATSTYDPVTGETTQTWAEETGEGLLTGYSQWEIKNGLVQTTDQRLIIKQADFDEKPGTSDDTRVEIDSVLYQIISPVKTGLANAVWDLQLRKA